VVIELWAVEAFCLSPVIACLFFVASVLSMLEMQVNLPDFGGVLKTGKYFFSHVKYLLPTTGVKIPA
jgi:hypothetical protein